MHSTRHELFNLFGSSQAKRIHYGFGVKWKLCLWLLDRRLIKTWNMQTEECGGALYSFAYCQPNMHKLLQLWQQREHGKYPFIHQHWLLNAREQSEFLMKRYLEFVFNFSLGRIFIWCIIKLDGHREARVACADNSFRTELNFAFKNEIHLCHKSDFY